MSKPKRLAELKVGEVYSEILVLRKLSKHHLLARDGGVWIDNEVVVMTDYSTMGSTVTAIYDRRKDESVEYLIEQLDEMKARNPYPESIFIPPTKEQYAKLHKLLKREGWSLDAFSGDMGRRVWNTCIEDIRVKLLGEDNA